MMKTKTNDPVNHPSHYCKPGELECIDQMTIIFSKRETMAFCVLNAYKYLSRYEDKGKPKQDLEKAIWYIKRSALLLDRISESHEYSHLFEETHITKQSITELDTYQKCIFNAKNLITHGLDAPYDAYWTMIELRDAVDSVERAISLLDRES